MASKKWYVKVHVTLKTTKNLALIYSWWFFPTHFRKRWELQIGSCISPRFRNEISKETLKFPPPRMTNRWMTTIIFQPILGYCLKTSPTKKGISHVTLNQARKILPGFYISFGTMFLEEAHRMDFQCSLGWIHQFFEMCLHKVFPSTYIFGSWVWLVIEDVLLFDAETFPLFFRGQVHKYGNGPSRCWRHWCKSLN